MVFEFCLVIKGDVPNLWKEKQDFIYIVTEASRD